MNKKNRYLLGICIACIIGTCFGFVHRKEEVDDNLSTETEIEKILIGVDALYFQRISRNQIQLSWSDRQDMFVDTYIVKKRVAMEGNGTGEWQVVETIKSDGNVNGIDWKIMDELDEVTPQQYEYRIDVELADTESGYADENVSVNSAVFYEAVEGSSILASNVKICIDPGHFNKPDDVTEVDEYQYVEGNFVLEVALELKQILKETYGIDSCLTRDSDTITLGGFIDDELDSAHISLRGEFAAEEDCDLFVSLHTNSNAEEANGYETFSQPLIINKPIIIVNTVALNSDTTIKIANATGAKLASVNYELGLANTDEFDEVTVDAIGEWTKEYNDGLNEVGTVLIRTGKKNPDYYGVLRGATNVGVPGMIIEHGFHSVPEVRKAAAESDLKEVWAQADASGIAYGFGFVK